MRSSHEIAGQPPKVLEYGASADTGSYIKSQPTPWWLKSKHVVNMANQSIKPNHLKVNSLNNINSEKWYKE